MRPGAGAVYSSPSLHSVCPSFRLLPPERPFLAYILCPGGVRKWRETKAKDSCGSRKPRVGICVLPGRGPVGACFKSRQREPWRARKRDWEHRREERKRSRAGGDNLGRASPPRAFCSQSGPAVLYIKGTGTLTFPEVVFASCSRYVGKGKGR